MATSKSIPKDRMSNAKWLAALDLCASLKYPTTEQIKEKANISRSTYFRWKKTDEFKKDLADYAKQTFASLSSRAVKKLEELLESDDEKVALRAAQTVLDKTIPEIEPEKKDNSHITMTVEYVEAEDEV